VTPNSGLVSYTRRCSRRSAWRRRSALSFRAVSEGGRLQVAFVAERVPNLPEEVALALYGVTQEALSNCTKQAHAQHVIVKLTGEKADCSPR
jgi:signal transduction histidine kinase